MPELPEVENIVQGLREHVVGRKIANIIIHKPLIIKGPYRLRRQQAIDTLQSKTVTAVIRRAKRLIITTDCPLSIIVQLGMTGKFLISPPNAPLAPHTHAVIKFLDNRELRFIDPRRFGRICFIENLDPENPDPAMIAAGFGKLGPDALDCTLPEFLQMLDSKRVIKTLLLDQTRIAGLGNIYVDEALHQANIHPASIACYLSKKKAEKLLTCINNILHSAIKHGGTTFSDYRNAYGELGRFKQFLKVYQRTDQPCRKCSTSIERVKIAGRSSHYCPKCQKLKPKSKV